MNEYSSTHYNFVDRPRQSNTSSTIDKAVIRNDTGNLQVWGCSGKTHTEVATTRNRQEFNKKTVGDLINEFNNKKRIKKIVLG